MISRLRASLRSAVIPLSWLTPLSWRGSAASSLPGLDALLEATGTPLLVYAADGRMLLLNQAARTLLDLPAHGPMPSAANPGYQMLEPDGVTPMPSDRRPFVITAGGEPVDTELVLVPAGGRPKRLIVQSRPVLRRDGSVQAVVITALDVTDLHEQNRLISWHSAQLSAIGEASRAVLRETDARSAMCRAAAEVCGARVATLMEPDGDGHLVATACHGADLVGLTVPLDGQSMVGAAYLGARTLTVADVSANDRVNQDLLRVWGNEGLEPLVGAAWVPVVNRGHCVGLVSVGFDRTVTDWPSRVTALEVLAGETAVALERQDLLRRLSAEAGSDGLTGAANRRTWDEVVPIRLQQSQRAGAPLSVGLLDLDHFKRYNDEHGHLAGDDLLRNAVKAWQQRLRPDDLLCRWGGEEFVVLLPSCTLIGAARLADDLRAMLPSGQTTSAGVATWNGIESAAELLARADAALYAAKRGGRDKVVADATQ
jgi:diguanylate cyclase (GGDEF)-like protein